MTNASAASTAGPFQYFRGYPARFEEARRQSLTGAWGCCGPVLLISLGCVGFSAWALCQTWGTWELVAVLGFVTWTVLVGSSLIAQVNVAWQTSIVPYFQSEIGGIESFASGYAVARACQSLDALAAELGLLPLSAFGFNDDWAGEQLVWHAPAEGLATCQGLLAALADRPGALPGQERVIRELRRIAAALQKAHEKKIPFCLLLRVGDGTNAMEWEQRQGTCF
ncbi:MAG: hypothetical protein JSS02_10065 [Planctomycetes bacterium]|nr:hypothetical protein [Planctomycetota bacterium]